MTDVATGVKAEAAVQEYDAAVLRAFLAERDAPCPQCGYNLRGATASVCPECSAALVLSLRSDDPRTAWDVLAMVAVILTTIYFGIMSVISAYQAAFGLVGVTVGGFRTWMWTNGVLYFLLAMIGAAWVIGVLSQRRRRLRPMWARPTTAAAGLLLGVFVVFLLGYAVRMILI